MNVTLDRIEAVASGGFTMDPFTQELATRILSKLKEDFGEAWIERCNKKEVTVNISNFLEVA